MAEIERVKMAVRDILRFHVGERRAILRRALVEQVRRQVPGANDRMVRMAVNLLRKEGMLICSRGGANGGYWIAEDWEDLLRFLEREWRPRYLDMMEAEKAMKQNAVRVFGPQLQLFQE